MSQERQHPGIRNHPSMVPSPRLFRRLSISGRPRPFRVVILGQMGVGKSVKKIHEDTIFSAAAIALYVNSLTVRYITRRFIGDYDPFLENIYSCTKCLDGETVALELLDTATQQVESSRQEVNIKWADAYILMYAVTDRCSFNECSRLRLLISSYSKRVGKRTPGETLPNQPVVLVGNQIDREQDRMVSMEEGLSKAEEFNCVSFHEISVRESVDGIDKIFEDIYMSYRYPKRNGSMRTNSVPSHTIPETRDHDGPKAVLHRRRQALHTIS